MCGKLGIEGVKMCGIVEVKHMVELNLANGMCPHCSFTRERCTYIRRAHVRLITQVQC